MSFKSNAIDEALRSALEPENFRRKTHTWFRDEAEVLQLINMQKSQFGDQYYINLAIWLKALGPPPGALQEHQCHVRMRESALLKEETSMRPALDLESQLGDEERSELVEDFLKKRLLPFAAECLTLSGLRRAFKEGRLKRAMVLKSAKELLAIQSC